MEIRPFLVSQSLTASWTAMNSVSEGHVQVAVATGSEIWNVLWSLFMPGSGKGGRCKF